MNFRPLEFSPEKQIAFDKINEQREKELNPIDPKVSVEIQEKVLFSLGKEQSITYLVKNSSHEELKDLVRFIDMVVGQTTKQINDVDDSENLGSQRDVLMNLLNKGPLYKMLVLESLQSSAYRAGVTSEKNANWEREMNENL